MNAETAIAATPTNVMSDSLIPRLMCLTYSIAWAVLAIGLYWRMSWATVIWPWEDSRMSFVFLSAIAAAVSASALWIATTGELSGAEGLAVDSLVTAGAAAVYFGQLAWRSDDDSLWTTAGAAAVITLLAAYALRWSRQQPVIRSDRMPRLVRGSFVVFCVALGLTSIALIAQVENAFPWDLQPGSSTVFGCIFLGSFGYFAVGVVRGTWAAAGGQLAAFLAYDLVLLITYAEMWLSSDDSGGGVPSYMAYGSTGSGDAINDANLVMYLTVLTYSAGLAVFYLFIRRDSRVRYVPLSSTGQGVR